MRFYGKTNDPISVQILSKISAVLCKSCSKRVLLKLDQKSLSFILNDRLLLGGLVMFSQIRANSLFDDFIVQSKVSHFFLLANRK